MCTITIDTTTLGQQKPNTCNDNKINQAYHYIDIFSIPQKWFTNLNVGERKKALLSATKSSKDGPFPPNSINRPSAVSFMDEVLVNLFLIVAFGFPLFWAFSMIGILVICDWSTCAIAVTVSLVLAFHPLPTLSFADRARLSARLLAALCRYFTYRVAWCGESLEKIQEQTPWIGACPPHGVMPFGNVLSVPGVNTLGVDFVGAPASIVMHAPFLRYMTILFPSVSVSAESIHDSIRKGSCVGIVPDGIAGIFRQCQRNEVVALKNRKGIARFALRHGVNVLPAYSFGNTSAFSAWWDNYGILERISRKLKFSFFIYWGRFGLPIPRRCQITMVCADPIIVERVPGGEPTEEQISELHDKILAGIRECFESHKHALGWGDKELVFV